MSGTFVISLDFELYWGVRDVVTLDHYRGHLLGERQAVPAMLRMFSDYGIHATWATVGFLFFRTREELLGSLPEVRPAYADRRLDPYAALDLIGEDEDHDPFHFAPSLIEMIREHPGQEIGTHTFSHYYCLAPGQDRVTFAADLEAARRTAKAHGVDLKSLVFPRNQFNADYLEVCADEGITAFRGNERAWIYAPRSTTLAHRAGRLLDAYVSLSGPNTYPLATVARTKPRNVAASRFLRPYIPSAARLDRLRVRRILKALHRAATFDEVFHLWWHPHNFGVNLNQNLELMRQILDEFALLSERNGMRSLNMAETADAI